MIIEHETFTRKDLSYNMSLPLETAKFLLQNAFGLAGSSRPVFRSADAGVVKMVNDEAVFNLVFDKINYEYINKLPIEDITVFSDKDFGHYFYELGRSILFITAMTVSRVEWFIESKDRIPELDYYYDAFLKLSDKVESTLTEFKKVLDFKDEDKTFEFDFKNAILDLKDKYEESGNYKDAPDLPNKYIVLFTYIGLYFVLIGTVLTLSDGKNDIISYIKNVNASSVDTMLNNVFGDENVNPNLKPNLIKALFMFRCITNLYNNTSGVKEHDPLLVIMQKFTEEFFKRIDNVEQVDFLEDISDLMNIAKTYNVFENVNNLTSSLPSYDNPDIWALGFEYTAYYATSFETDEEGKLDVLDFFQPQMKNYIDSSVKNFNNLDIEKGFNFVNAILNNLDNNKIVKIDPRSILVLTMLGAAFRKIEKKNSISSNSIISEKVHSAIDLIDCIIVSLYNLWFKSNKFFKQCNRPHYCKEGAESTLCLLKSEVNDILLIYQEYIRFGISETIYKSDEALFKEYFKNRINSTSKEYGCCKYITEKLLLPLDPDVFVRECAIRGCRSLVYSAMTCDENLSIEKLCSMSANVELPKAILRTFSSEKIENYTGIKILDKVIYSLSMIKDYVQENPFIYMLSVYCIMLNTIQKIFESNNVGNYFDFGNAESSLNSYKLDSIVSDLVLKPSQKIAISESDLL